MSNFTVASCYPLPPSELWSCCDVLFCFFMSLSMTPYSVMIIIHHIPPSSFIFFHVHVYRSDTSNAITLSGTISYPISFLICFYISHSISVVSLCLSYFSTSISCISLSVFSNSISAGELATFNNQKMQKINLTLSEMATRTELHDVAQTIIGQHQIDTDGTNRD